VKDLSAGVISLYFGQIDQWAGLEWKDARAVVVGSMTFSEFSLALHLGVPGLEKNTASFF